jgi:hypothetical protein
LGFWVKVVGDAHGQFAVAMQRSILVIVRIILEAAARTSITLVTPRRLSSAWMPR